MTLKDLNLNIKNTDLTKDKLEKNGIIIFRYDESSTYTNPKNIMELVLKESNKINELYLSNSICHTDKGKFKAIVLSTRKRLNEIRTSNNVIIDSDYPIIVSKKSNDRIKTYVSYNGEVTDYNIWMSENNIRMKSKH